MRRKKDSVIFLPVYPKWVDSHIQIDYADYLLFLNSKNMQLDALKDSNLFWNLFHDLSSKKENLEENVKTILEKIPTLCLLGRGSESMDIYVLSCTSTCSSQPNTCVLSTKKFIDMSLEREAFSTFLYYQLVKPVLPQLSAKIGATCTFETHRLHRTDSVICQIEAIHLVWN